MANPAAGEALSSRWRRYVRAWAPILAVTALAATLRFVSLGDVPPGLYHDEARNGLDALGVLAGNVPIYFPANHGREPLFVYLIAATVGLLGRSPGAVRLAAALCGTLTIPLTYLMGSAWFNRRVALLSSAILAITVWHIQLSRIGFRAVMLPLAIAALLWSGWSAFQSDRAGPWLLAGFLYGITWYTYVAARFTPVALLGLVAYLLVTGQIGRLWPGALYFLIGALITLAPLGAYAAHHWETVMGRPSQVSLLNPAVHEGNLWGTLGQHIIRTLGMVFIRGDTIPRHNIPGRPVFTPLIGAATVAGTVRAAAGVRRRELGSALVLIWVAAMLVPTIAAADAPHFLRAVGVLPPLVFLPALGLDGAWTAWARPAHRLVGAVLLCLVLAFNLGATVRDYFVGYGASPGAAYAFEAAATHLATEINRYTGIGWQGEGVTASGQGDDEGRRVFLDTRLWEAWEALAFLVPEQEALVRFQPDGTLPRSSADKLLLLLWPYDDVEPYLAALPRPAEIEAHQGPLTRGDLEEEAYPAYVAYVVEPLAGEDTAPLARFGESVALRDASIEATDQQWRVRLSWTAQDDLDENYTVAVFLCDGRCAGDAVVAQHDAQPGGGYYPTYLWRPGDVVLDLHTLEFPAVELGTPQIGVGLYAWPALERLPVAHAVGSSSEDLLLLPVADWSQDAD